MFKKIMFVLCFFCLVGCGNNSKITEDLDGIKSRESYVDSRYELVTKVGNKDLSFDHGNSFHEGRAVISKTHKEENGEITSLDAVIDKEGNIISDYIYDYIGVFSDSLADVRKGTGKIGFIDKSGKLVLDFKYDMVLQGFKNGYAKVRLDGEDVFINKQGKVYKYNPYFANGLTAISNKDGKWGYMNKKKKVVIDYKYDNAHEFHNGMAAIYVKDEGWGFIDTKGKEVIKPQYEKVFNFNENLAGVYDGDKWGYINKSGEYVIEPKFLLSYGAEAHSFNNGVAVVSLDNESWFLIDSKGKELGNFVTNEIFRFKDGFAPISTSNGAGFTNIYGDSYINVTYKDVGTVSEGLMAVSKNGKYGFINTKGNLVINCVFDEVSDFHEGLAFVKKGDKSAYINRMGDIIIGNLE